MLPKCLHCCVCCWLKVDRLFEYCLCVKVTNIHSCWNSLKSLRGLSWQLCYSVSVARLWFYGEMCSAIYWAEALPGLSEGSSANVGPSPEKSTGRLVYFIVEIAVNINNVRVESGSRVITGVVWVGWCERQSGKRCCAHSANVFPGTGLLSFWIWHPVHHPEDCSSPCGARKSYVLAIGEDRCRRKKYPKIRYVAKTSWRDFHRDAKRLMFLLKKTCWYHNHVFISNFKIQWKYPIAFTWGVLG